MLLVAMLAVTLFAVPATAKTVTSGAFCASSEAGNFGHTVTGLLMRCTTTSSDSRLRWRQFGAAFGDVKGNTHEKDIEKLASAGVTRGCNPPDNTLFCPNRGVTRQEMSAFMVRALGLTDANHPGFRDVPSGSTFDLDIRRLAKAGVTKGCNPPANDRFCPTRIVTREEMAAFMGRGYGLTATSSDGNFADVPASNSFRQDINRLATAGITLGCNPPANTNYCPKRPVTRDQMSSFMVRAGL